MKFIYIFVRVIKSQCYEFGAFCLVALSFRQLAIYCPGTVGTCRLATRKIFRISQDFSINRLKDFREEKRELKILQL